MRLYVTQAGRSSISRGQLSIEERHHLVPLRLAHRRRAGPYPSKVIGSRRRGTLDVAQRLTGMMGRERRFEGVTIRARSIIRLRALADIGAPPSYKRAPSGRGSKG